MTGKPITIDGRFWRMLGVRWQREPLSGAGAARSGGRWNRPGEPALYLSSDHSTAIAEYNQGLVHPGTLVAFDIHSTAIADLTDTGVSNSLELTDADLRADWRRIVEVERGMPPGWGLADQLTGAGFDGMLVPSVVAPGTNLVLWQWSIGGPGANVRVVDPHGDLRG